MYLEMNCSACHRPSGGATSALYLERHTPLEKMRAVNEKPSQGTFGIDEVGLIKPGRPQQSALLYRIATSGPEKMPKLGSHEPDVEGARLIWDWIESLRPDEQAAMSIPSKTVFTSTDEALLEWHRMTDLPAPQARERASQWVELHNDLAIKGLFYRWIDDEARVETIGDSPDIEQLMRLEGDPEAGKKWFSTAKTSQCRNCHHVDRADPLVGPTLAGIGKFRSPRQLLNSMIDPSDRIENKWKTHTVLTIDGEIISGLKVSQSRDLFVLKSSDGKEHRLPQDEIEEIRTNPQSLMPSGLLSEMTPQQVADLLAYIRSLP